MRKISPALQAYDWGSHSFIQDFLGIQQDGALAEAWYGAHPKAPSQVGEHNLLELIKQDPEYWLGKAQLSMPYLLKILAAKRALSIQVHPNKLQAESGFAEENLKGMALDDPKRNFRDDNHKPELMMALTEFYALCGFRKYTEIIDIFNSLGLDLLFFSFADFAALPNAESFTKLYLETLQHPDPSSVIDHLLKLYINGEYSNEIRWIKKLNTIYPGDPAIISPLLMNLVLLMPYEAIYLDAGIIHAYLEGSGIEIMASGDNVLRAGLTSKHIDIPKLCEIMTFEPFMPEIQEADLLSNALYGYHTAAKDFKLYYIIADAHVQNLDIKGIKIVLCSDGEITLVSDNSSLTLISGESAVIPAAYTCVQISGDGKAIIAAPGQ